MVVDVRQLVRVASFAIAVFVISMFSAQPVRAAQTYTQAEAMAQCSSERDANNAQLEAAGSPLRWKCVDSPDGVGGGLITDIRCGWGGGRDCDITGGNWAYKNDVPPKDPCKGIPDVTMNFQGAMADGWTFNRNVRQDDGSMVCCGAAFQKEADPVMNASGIWFTFGTLHSTGEMCGLGDGAGGGWHPPDGSKPADPAPPPAPDAPPKGGPPQNDPAPKTCGEVSCFDPNNNEYCTQGSSGMLCTKGPPDGSQGGTCASGGDKTICAGRPQAPAPPTNKVPDPPTATAGTDRYQRAEGPKGDDRYQVTSTVYNNGPGTVSNGAKPGDSQPPKGGGSGGNGGGDPAPGGSTGGPGGSGDGKKGDGTGASGGGDCNNPPNVEGSAALGMIATQTWHVRCDGVNEKVNDNDTSVPGLEGVPDGTNPNDSVVHEVSGFGADKLDYTGFLGGSGKCPAFPPIDIAQFDVHYTGPPPGWCDIVNVIGKMVMLMAVVWSYMILMRK